MPMVKRKRDKRNNKQNKEFEERLLEIKRVSRVTTGGRRMSFRATMLLGNKKGRIGIGIAKGPDVGIAVRKASHEAYKTIVTVPLTEGRTIPYAINIKHKASRIKLIPAASGTGLKAGSSLRTVLELAGYENILSKIVGSNNKLNVALTAIKALSNFKHADAFAQSSKQKEEDKKEKKDNIDDKKPTDKMTAGKKPTTNKTKSTPAKTTSKKTTPKTSTTKKTDTKKATTKKTEQKKTNKDK